MGVLSLAPLRTENTRALVLVFGVAVTAGSACGVVVRAYGWCVGHSGRAGQRAICPSSACAGPCWCGHRRRSSLWLIGW